MAKKFAGFKPETLTNKILPALGYNGPTDDKSINQFLASNPAAAAKMGKYTLAARRAVEGEPVIKAAQGQLINPISPQETGQAVSPTNLSQQLNLVKLPQGPIEPIQPMPYPEFDPQMVQRGGPEFARTAQTAQTADTGNNPQVSDMGSAAKMTKAITADPKKLVQRAQVAADDGGPATQIDPNAGQAGSPTMAVTSEAQPAAAAEAAPAQPAAQVQASQAAPAVDQALQQQQAAQGQVSQQAQMEAAQADPTQASSLALEAAQGEAAQVQGAPTRKLETGELIDGSAVDQQKVQDIYGDQKLEAATVSGELENLMEDFEGGKTPPWAAGAMRNANAMLAARGIGASSMAGMAVVQAAMEAALPIAQMDASNKQQVAMESARQRANFLNMEFTQEFQTKVQNAAKISEIANMNFTADQQVALENARMAQTMNLANLDNRQAKVMADAATMSQMDMANLNNRQQAQVQNAQAFLQMDMTNLSNEQQMNMFKAQERVNALMSDTAAENAAKQFNATSENQTNQFFASLQTQVSQFNTEQRNAMSRFNAGEANALAQFNSAQVNAREQFNATNHLVVAQANAQWAQAITTAENAANNQANRDAALAANNLTMTAYNNIVQRERDTLAWAWQSGENAAQRDANIAIAKINAEADAGDTSGIGLSEAAGTFLGQIAINAADLLFN
jgi:hypothetical protein